MNWAWLVSLFLASTQSITRLGGGAALAQSVGPEPIDFRKYEDGVYRIKLCALWPRCLDFEEHIGFTNKTCSKEEDLLDDPVGPILRDFSSSRNWKSWKISFSDQTKESAIVTIQNFYDSESSQPRCNDHFISDFPDTCESLSKDEEKALYMAEEPRKFKIRLAEDALDCINIVDDSRPPGCPNLFSVSEDCDQLHVNLAAKDDGSGRQRWQLVKEM